MIPISVNELETLVRKAAVGAGMGHGQASEAAQSLVWLAAAGVDCLPAMVDILAAWADGRTGPVGVRCEARCCTLATPTGVTAGAACAATALRDFTGIMLEHGRFDRVQAREVQAPWLALGRLASEPRARPLVVECFEPESGDSRWRAWLPEGTGGIRAEGDITVDSPGDLRVSPAADGAIPARRGSRLAADTSALFEHRLAVDPAHYHALKRFFNLTLVPDSEESRRHGAGAGLVDSD